jgi:hypothetical protein
MLHVRPTSSIAIPYMAHEVAIIIYITVLQFPSSKSDNDANFLAKLGRSE